jgi:hypothetical protein
MSQRTLRLRCKPSRNTNKPILKAPLATVILLAALVSVNLATPALAQEGSLLLVSRVQYDGNTFGNPANYPYIFTDPTVSGVQGSIHLDVYLPFPNPPAIFSLPLTDITTSFSSKSEGALTRSVDRHFLTYMAYDGPDGAQGVSNSYTTGQSDWQHEGAL